jgi:lipoprotein-anchoring transpeptidase ErfK/SrfK
LAYARKALKLNPNSTRARQGVEWAEGRLNQARGRRDRVESSVPQNSIAKLRNEAVAIPVRLEPVEVKTPVESKSSSRLLLFGGLLGLLVCIVFVFAAWSAVISPAFASLLPSPAVPAAAEENHWARVDIPKPAVAAVDVSALAQVESTPTDLPIAESPTPAPVEATPIPPTEAPTATPAATETPGVLAMEIVVDTPTSEYVVPVTANDQPAQPAYPAKGNGVRWIDVNLSEQRVYAYEGDVVVNSFVVSTGTWQTPTVTGKFKIWIKLKSTTMSGPGYHLTNVPYTMYFHKGYGLHGTYWHNNFGTPMSHGCVNLSIPDAEWLYYWASEGTTVNVHH